MNKQTAVEWLVDELLDGKLLMPSLIEQAKAMEKQQMFECWETAHQAGRFEGKNIAIENWQTFKEYYNETFKSEHNGE